MIGIGSAVLGGAGKTPVAIAYALALHAAGARVALAGHAFGAAPGFARQVHIDDPLSEVGDDALTMAHAVESRTIPIWVAPRRQEAIEAASHHADVVVVDGLLQTSPVRLGRSVLVVDAAAPWGSGSPLPFGDLRASPQRLLELCDEVVIARDPSAPHVDLPPLIESKPCRQACLSLEHAADPTGAPHQLTELITMRVGLLLTVAHPERVLVSLQVRGVQPSCCWLGADHHNPSRSQQRAICRLARLHRLDAWLVTAKCCSHFSGDGFGAPIWTLLPTTQLDPAPLAVVGSRPCVRHEPCFH